MMFERRKEQRQSVFLDARIGFGRREFRAICLVQNVSGSGAKVVLLKAADLPNEFDVGIPRTSMVYRAQARWRIGKSIGVEIKQRHSVGG